MLSNALPLDMPGKGLANKGTQHDSCEKVTVERTKAKARLLERRTTLPGPTSLASWAYISLEYIAPPYNEAASTAVPCLGGYVYDTWDVSGL